MGWPLPVLSPGASTTMSNREPELKNGGYPCKYYTSIRFGGDAFQFPEFSVEGRRLADLTETELSFVEEAAGALTSAIACLRMERGDADMDLDDYDEGKTEGIG